MEIIADFKGRRQLSKSGWKMDEYYLPYLTSESEKGETWSKSTELGDWCLLIHPPGFMRSAMVYLFYGDDVPNEALKDQDFETDEDGTRYYNYLLLDGIRSVNDLAKMQVHMEPVMRTMEEILERRIGEYNNPQPEPAPEPESPSTPSVSRFSSTSDIEAQARANDNGTVTYSGPVGEPDPGSLGLAGITETSDDGVEGEEVSPDPYGIREPSI